MREPEVIASIADLELVANRAHHKFGEATWWRGHFHADWTLQPSIWRPGHAGLAGKTERAYMSHFQGRAICQQESRRMPQDDDYIEWLFLARHYGLPTRLLDWTESPLVALYFALNSDDADKESANMDACLWALSPGKLNLEHSSPDDPKEAQDGLISIKEPIVKAIASVSFGVKQPACPHCGEAPFPKVLALQPWESNERIIAQAGRFTLHSSQDDLRALLSQKLYLKTFIVPKEAREILKVRLEVFGIRRWDIFPDLENLAKGLSNSSFGD